MGVGRFDRAVRCVVGSHRRGSHQQHRRRSGQQAASWIAPHERSSHKRSPGERRQVEAGGEGSGQGGASDQPAASFAVDADPPAAPGTCRHAGSCWQVVGEHDGEGREEGAKADQDHPVEPPPVGAAHPLHEAVREEDRHRQREDAVDQHQAAAELKGMVGQSPAGEFCGHPVGASQQHRQQWWLAGVEVRHSVGTLVDHRIDRIPARFGHEVLDREASPFHQAADGQPAAAVVGGQEGPHQTLVAANLLADGLLVDLFSFRLAAFDGVGDDPLL